MILQHFLRIHFLQEMGRFPCRIISMDTHCFWVFFIPIKYYEHLLGFLSEGLPGIPKGAAHISLISLTAAPRAALEPPAWGFPGRADPGWWGDSSHTAWINPSWAF